LKAAIDNDLLYKKLKENTWLVAIIMLGILDKRTQACVIFNGVVDSWSFLKNALFVKKMLYFWLSHLSKMEFMFIKRE